MMMPSPFTLPFWHLVAVCVFVCVYPNDALWRVKNTRVYMKRNIIILIINGSTCAMRAVVSQFVGGKQTDRQVAK